MFKLQRNRSPQSTDTRAHRQSRIKRAFFNRYHLGVRLEGIPSADQVFNMYVLMLGDMGIPLKVGTRQGDKGR